MRPLSSKSLHSAVSSKNEKAAPGRPPLRSSDETLELLLTAAVTEYQLNGYAKSTMGAIAKRAGISLRTLYKFVSEKEALFRTAAERRIGQHILSLDTHATCVGGNAREALKSLTRAYAHQILDPDTLLTTKLVIAESDQFPELSIAFFESTKRIANAFDHNFALIAANGKIEVSAQEIELLRLMLIGSQRGAILNHEKPCNAAAVNALADRALAVILRHK